MSYEWCDSKWTWTSSGPVRNIVRKKETFNISLRLGAFKTYHCVGYLLYILYSAWEMSICESIFIGRGSTRFEEYSNCPEGELGRIVRR